MTTGTELLRPIQYDEFKGTLPKDNPINPSRVAADILFGSILPQFSDKQIEILSKNLKAFNSQDSSKEELLKLTNACNEAIKNKNAFACHRCLVEFEKLLGTHPELRYLLQKA